MTLDEARAHIGAAWRGVVCAVLAAAGLRGAE